MPLRSPQQILLVVISLLFSVIVSAQFKPEIIEIKNSNGKTAFRFGDALNMKLKYQVIDPDSNEKALSSLKSYYLIINAVPYPEKNLQSMQSFFNTKDSTHVIKDTSVKENIAIKGKMDTLITTKNVTYYTITFQTRLPDAQYTDSNINLSAFWKQVYLPLHKQRTLVIAMTSAQATSENTLRPIPFLFVFYEHWRVVLFIILFIVLILLVVWNASRDRFSLLRDDPAAGAPACADPFNNPFSLSRVQVLVWTFVIFGMIAYLWSITNYFPVITSAHLVLLGIAAGQRILAQVMDASKGPLKNIASPNTLANIAANPALPPSAVCSRGFFTDLISDNTGLSITRLQYLIITFIFLVMFVTTAIQKLQLMNFSIEQLALMGTSAGLYLWNKKLDQ